MQASTHRPLRLCLLLLLLSASAVLCQDEAVVEEQPQDLQQPALDSLPRSLGAGARRQPAAAEAVEAADGTVVAAAAAAPPSSTPVARSKPPATAAAKPPTTTEQQDYINQLYRPSDDADAPAPAPPPSPSRVSRKKAAAGVRNEYINQLLGAMKQSPSPKVKPQQQQQQPKQQKRRRDPGAASSQQQGQQQPSKAPAAPAAAEAPAAAAARPQADEVSDEDYVCPPGFICAQRGSKLCGNTICGPDEKCYNSAICCSTPLCNGQCCAAPNTCIGGRCAPPGSKSCGDNVCVPPKEDCYNTATGAPVGSSAPAKAAIGVLVCCSSAKRLCGVSCCGYGEACLLGKCRMPGSFTCGDKAVCSAGQQCLGNTTCCAANSVLCAGTCCPSTAQCINNRCEKAGSSACGAAGLVCPAGKVCLTAQQQSLQQTYQVAACCLPGQQLCGSECCSTGSTQTCIAVNGMPQCVGLGSVTCGGRVCPANQRCAELPAPRCCNVNETVCNGQCCGVGNICVSNQCVPSNSLICGTTVCRGPNQICLGSVLQPLCCNQGDVVCGGGCCPVSRCKADVCQPPPAPAPVPTPTAAAAAARG